MTSEEIQEAKEKISKETGLPKEVFEIRNIGTRIELLLFVDKSDFKLPYNFRFRTEYTSKNWINSIIKRIKKCIYIYHANMIFLIKNITIKAPKTTFDNRIYFISSNMETLLANYLKCEETIRFFLRGEKYLRLVKQNMIFESHTPEEITLLYTLILDTFKNNVFSKLSCPFCGKNDSIESNETDIQYKCCNKKLNIIKQKWEQY